MHCELRGCQPLEVFTRSTQRTTNMAIMASIVNGQLADRQQRLQAVRASLGIRRTAGSQAVLDRIAQRVGVLTQHGVPRMTCELIIVVLHEAILLLDADRAVQLGASAVLEHAGSNCTTFIDHMLPGKQAGTHASHSRPAAVLLPTNPEGRCMPSKAQLA